MKIIDAHQHFWSFNQQDFGWIDDSMTLLQRDFHPRHYLSAISNHHTSDYNIVGSVVIQARQSIDETEWLLKLSDEHDFILGVVGWVDLKATDLDKQLQAYTKHKKLKGFRHVIHDEPELDFMLNPLFIQGVSLLNEYGFSYDILIKSEHLPNTILFLEQLPVMNIVIDHIAKPNIKDKEWSSWADNMVIIANRFPHVSCKISGVVTEADWHLWHKEDLQRYIATVVQLFGEKRIMFGTDWPVCQIAANLDSVIDLCASSLDSRITISKESVFFDNATSFYSLEQ